MAMLRQSKRHGKRERISIRIGSPCIAIRKREPGIFVVDCADFTAIKQSDELMGHGLFFKELRILLMSCGAPLAVVPGEVSDSRSMDTPRAFKVRSIKPMAARGLPCSTSLIHFRLVPAALAKAA